MKNRHKISWKIAGLALVAIFLGLSSCDEAGVTNPYNATLVFEQIDYDLDGFVGTDTSWGMVTLTYNGSSDILYFNLAVDGAWAIQNVPVLSVYGPGVQQSYTFSFDLGVDQGTDVTQLEYAFDLTVNTVGTMPTNTSTAIVSDGSYIVYSGFGDVPDYVPPGSYTSTGAGGVLKEIRVAKLPDADKLPNQESKKKGCVPTSVSNSLFYLNAKHGMGMTDEQMNIERVEDLIDWDPIYGCYGWHSDDYPPHDAWWETKAKEMDRLGGYQITTEQVTMENINDIFDEIDRGQDVEMLYAWHIIDTSTNEIIVVDGKEASGGHAVNVTALILTDYGTYYASFTDDEAQDQPGGLRTFGLMNFDVMNDPADPNEKIGFHYVELGKDIYGRDLAKQYFIHYFVVECPE